MISHRDFLISYRIDVQYGTRVEMTLLHVASVLAEFLEMNPLYISTQGVVVSYLGSRLILEPRDCPSGRPQGIILPRLLVEPVRFEKTSERSNRLTVDRTPRPDLIKDRKETLISDSERSRGEWSRIINYDSISLRNETEAKEYVDGVCRAMFDLTQAFLNVVDAKQRAITLIINNNS